MKRWALIEAGVCITVVEQGTSPTINGEWQEVTGMHVGPNYIFNEGGSWDPPLELPEE